MSPNQDFGAFIGWTERFLDIAALMPLQTRAALSRGIGRLWYLFDPRHRRIAMQNLDRAFGDELRERERTHICRGVFEHLARVALEVPCLQRMNEKNLEQYITFSGFEHMETAMSRGRGLLVMASHFGNWELMSLAFSIRYFPFNLVVRPLDNPLLDGIIESIRCKWGHRTIPKKGSIRQILRALGKREAVALLVDQNVDWYDGAFVPFFKDIACTNKALAVLALRTGAPVVPVYNVRQEDGRYVMMIEPEVPVLRTGDMTSDIEENTALFNRIIEGYVRRHPEQWFWVHQRWKTRPCQPWPRGSKPS